MGKGTQLLGTITGKVGSVIGSTNPITTAKQKQIVRAYTNKVANPENPRTIGQVAQRAKLLPVNMHYRAFKHLIDRGFEGVKYGQESRNQYLRIALGGNTPDDRLAPLMKGATDYEPSLLPISRGTLTDAPTIDFSIGADQYDDENVQVNGTDYVLAPCIGFPLPGEAATMSETAMIANPTIGMVADAIVSAGYAEYGDQLTIAGYYANADTDALFGSAYHSIYLNKDDGTLLPVYNSNPGTTEGSTTKDRYGHYYNTPTITGTTGLAIVRNILGSVDSFGQWYLAIIANPKTYWDFATPNDVDANNARYDIPIFLAGTCAISRDDDTTRRRSNANMQPNLKWEGWDRYQDSVWMDEVYPTYAATDGEVTNWELQQQSITSKNSLPNDIGLLTTKTFNISDIVIDSSAATAANLTNGSTRLLVGKLRSQYANATNGGYAVFRIPTSSTSEDAGAMVDYSGTGIGGTITYGSANSPQNYAGVVTYDMIDWERVLGVERPSLFDYKPSYGHL